MNRRLLVILLLVCFSAAFWVMRPLPAVPVLGSLIQTPQAAVDTVASLPQVAAKSAALMDVGSFRLLAGKNLHQRLPMASTTKVMTAILAIESGRWSETVVVSADACREEPSSIWLVPGEQITLEYLVYGLMLRSGNDAAHAIADFLGGSVAGFAQLMNAKAAQLGLQDTHFVNPHGLPDPDHYTSAYDLAKIAAYALQNKRFSEIVATRQIAIPSSECAPARVWYNKNRLLVTYSGADGVKTGWTRAAGYCLVASATRGQARAVAVVLDSPDDFGETARMLDFAFDNYQPQTIVTAGQFFGSVPVNHGTPPYVGAVAAESYTWPMREDEMAGCQTEVVVPDALSAPVRAGQQIGTVRVLRAGECLAEIPLVADQAAERGWLECCLRQWAADFWQLLNAATGGADR